MIEMNLLKYIILGLIQGLTETIPVSSSGHLMIFKTLMNAKMDYDTIAIMTNFGSLVAIIILFWPDIKKIIFDLQIGEVNDEIMETLGRLKYRTSYGQNALQHSVEVAYISGLLASEMGVDAKLAKRCGLFHDIGKALTYTMEGSHVELGTKFLSKYSEPKEVLNTVASHHGDCKPESIMAIIVKAADTISASRPGARRENLESYTRRIEKLENIVNNFEEVERCYVIQAGREVRVVVSPDKVTDDGMVVLARNICKKIEENLNYPGQIRVSMLRENRIIEYAK